MMSAAGQGSIVEIGDHDRVLRAVTPLSDNDEEVERISRCRASAIDTVLPGHDIAAGAAIEVIVADTAVEHVIAGKPIELDRCRNRRKG